ncbi:hypothetical protein PIB30_078932 [Stylosanthes scabra]|uniref:Uncharacterized protein n=1 Tax=Stylosanthes scabra TaxID=79078 RepID=A0ABU6QRM1_9FABA|nr:hypothetical protein [Stylosanthes scabra]
MKKGSLQNKKRSLEAKQSNNSTHMRGRARICVEEHAYACHNKPKPCLSNSITLRRGTFTSSFPRICVGTQQAHVPDSRLHNLKRDLHFTKPHSSTHRHRRSTHMRGRHLGSKQSR